jgi:hypothetical protein
LGHHTINAIKPVPTLGGIKTNLTGIKKPVRLIYPDPSLPSDDAHNDLLGFGYLAGLILGLNLMATIKDYPYMIRRFS